MSETEGPIKTPKQLLYAVLAAFLVPIVIIVLLTQYVGNLKNPSNASDAYTEEKVLERIHTRIDKHEGRIVLIYHRSRRHNLVSFAFEVL